MAAPVWKLLDQPSYHFDPETKQQSMEWQHSGSPHPQKFQVQKSAGKVLTSIFWDQDSFIPIDCLPKGQTINVEYYLSFCWCNWRTFWRKNAAGRFLHNNAPAHRALATQKKLAYLGLQCLDHPPYSLDLAPSDYHLFPGRKKQLKGHHFSSDAEVIAAAETWLDGQPSWIFFEWLAKFRATG